MKKLVIFLVLSIAVSAAFYDEAFVRGDIEPAQFPKIMCESEKRLGAIDVYNELICCINENGNKYCENDEAVLGLCFNGVCMWPTDAYRPWYSWRYRAPPCTEKGFLVGNKYDPLMEWAGCEETDGYWCCGRDTFKAINPVVAKQTMAPKNSMNINGALVVMFDNDWRLAAKGVGRPLELKVFNWEKARCARGGQEVRIIDPQYGSMFMDVGNIKPGMRAFYMVEDNIVPLVTWC